MKDLQIINIDIKNIDKHGCYCLMNRKQIGYSKKIDWLKERLQEGLKVKMLHSEKDGYIGFIEYISGEFSWRAFSNKDYMFIHCIYIAKKKNRNNGNGNILIDECINDAKKENKKGVAMITSGGSMLAEKDIFLKSGFAIVDTAPPKYQLMVKQFTKGELPKFTKSQNNSTLNFKGLHLVFSNQCPYFYQSVNLIKEVSNEYGLKLMVSEINNYTDAQMAPSLYGVFNLTYNGTLIAEHYISKTRFINILEKELNIKKTI